MRRYRTKVLLAGLFLPFLAGCGRGGESGSAFPAFAVGEIIAGGEGQGRLVFAHADVDGDGDEDLFLQRGDGAPLVLLNRNGRFVREAAWDLPTTGGLIHDACFFDLNGDSLPELYLAREGADALFKNEGTHYTDISREAGIDTRQRSYGVMAVQTVSLKRPDLLITGPDFNRLLRFDDRGVAAEMASQLGVAGKPVPSFASLSADLDGDGLIDLFVANSRGPQSFFRNTGDQFREQMRGMSGSGGTTAIAAADVDGDGDVDLFSAGGSGGGDLFFNNGQGGFAPSGAMRQIADSLAGLRIDSAHFFDPDGNGRPDLVVGGSFGIRFFLNAAKGTFLSNRDMVAEAGDPVSKLGSADLDGDGAPELLAACDGGLKIWRNRYKSLTKGRSAP
ncbi:MAG TPA: VCBS repeat-containing protein [Calditrichia bacterium]|nr:VCBS repeat-containing protein [Calditrichia bacterium]